MAYEGRLFEIAQQPLGGVAEVRAFEYSDTTPPQVFIKGAPLIYDTANPGQVIEADPGTLTGLVGITLQKVNSNPGFEMGHDSQVIFKTWISFTVSSAVIRHNNTIFSGAMLDPSLVPVPPDVTHIGQVYDIARDPNTFRWYITAATGATVEITGIVPDRPGQPGSGFHLFKFTDAAMAPTP